MSQELTRKFLVLGFLLLALAALLMSPAERKVHATETCMNCSLMYQNCYANCLSEDVEFCKFRCDLEYSACVYECEP